MLLLSDEMDIVDDVVIDDVSELDVVKVGEEGDKFVEELLLDAIIIESSGSMMNFLLLNLLILGIICLGLLVA